jgi:hypothetical protein
VWESLAKVAEKSSASVSPLTGAIVFGYIYLHLPGDRVEYHYLSIVLAFCLGISSLCFCTRLVFNWPRLPVVDSD